MATRLKFKISSNRKKLYATRDEAFAAAHTACLRQGEPQVLMAVRPDGVVRAWEVVSTEKLYFEFNQSKGGLVTLVDGDWESWKASNDRCRGAKSF